MLATTFLTALLATAAAFKCPERDESLPLKAAGEACGGVCDEKGLCAEGLKCVQPKVPITSFAILQPKRPGVCTAPPARQLVGALTPAEVDDEANAAAKFATGEIMKMSNELYPASLSKVISVKKQVVAGIKYVLVLEMTDGKQHRIAVVDQAWMTPRYTIIANSHEVL